MPHSVVVRNILQCSGKHIGHDTEDSGSDLAMISVSPFVLQNKDNDNSETQENLPQGSW